MVRRGWVNFRLTGKGDSSDYMSPILLILSSSITDITLNLVSTVNLLNYTNELAAVTMKPALCFQGLGVLSDRIGA